MTKVSYAVSIGYRDPKTPADDPTLFVYTKDFDRRADVVRYLKQVRKDCHKLDFVLTDDWKYDNVINGAYDNVIVQVFVRAEYGYTRNYSPRKMHNVYRPHIALDDNGNWIDLNK